MFSIVFLFWRKTESAGGDWFNTDLTSAIRGLWHCGRQIQDAADSRDGRQSAMVGNKAGFSRAAGSKMPGNKHRAAFPGGPGKKEIKK
jgi:hypothetical protein